MEWVRRAPYVPGHAPQLPARVTIAPVKSEDGPRALIEVSGVMNELKLRYAPMTGEISSRD